MYQTMDANERITDLGIERVAQTGDIELTNEARTAQAYQRKTGCTRREAFQAVANGWQDDTPGSGSVTDPTRNDVDMIPNHTDEEWSQIHTRAREIEKSDGVSFEKALHLASREICSEAEPPSVSSQIKWKALHDSAVQLQKETGLNYESALKVVSRRQ